MIIFPNPVENYIKKEEANNLSNYKIHNMSGELIQFGKLQEQLIESETLPDDYCLILMLEGNFISGNFVKL